MASSYKSVKGVFASKRFSRFTKAVLYDVYCIRYLLHHYNVCHLPRKFVKDLSVFVGVSHHPLRMRDICKKHTILCVSIFSSFTAVYHTHISITSCNAMPIFSISPICPLLVSTQQPIYVKWLYFLLSLCVFTVVYCDTYIPLVPNRARLCVD